MKTIPDSSNKTPSYILHKHLFEYIKIVETSSGKTPPNVARAYFLFGSLVWNAYAVLDPSLDFIDGFVCDRQSAFYNAGENQKWKIFYVLFHVLWNELRSSVYPNMAVLPNPSPRVRYWITRRFQIACRQYLNQRKQDGYDSTKPFSYANEGKYIEANSGVEQDLATYLADSDAWTPLVTNKSGSLVYQKPLHPFYGEVRNWFSSTDWSSIDSQASDYFPSSSLSDKQVEELVEICSDLSPEEKMKAEVWAGFEPDRATPPAKSMILLALVLASQNYSTKQSATLIGGSSACLFHAAIAAWKIKYQYMQARPIQLIRKKYYQQNIISPDDGTLKNGSFWLPYQPLALYTPPFPDYISGHSTFTMAFSTFMNLATGSDMIPTQGCIINPEYLKLFSAVFDQMNQPSLFSTLALKPSASLIVPDTPVIPIELKWQSWSQIAREAGMSRIYGGIHWENSNSGGLAIGQTVASIIMEKLNWNKLRLVF